MIVGSLASGDTDIANLRKPRVDRTHARLPELQVQPECWWQATTAVFTALITEAIALGLTKEP